jgi:rhodanese-related sulfurtransferase
MVLRNVTPIEAQRLASEGAILVDIREAAELGSGRVPGALHLALSRLNQEELPSDHSGPVVFLCRSGGRTTAYARQLEAKVPSGCEALVMAGGVEGWRRAGLALEI